MNSASFNAEPQPAIPKSEAEQSATKTYIGSFLPENIAAEKAAFRKLLPAELVNMAEMALHQAYTHGQNTFEVSPEMLGKEVPTPAE